MSSRFRVTIAPYSPRKGSASLKCSIYCNFLRELRRTPLGRSSRSGDSRKFRTAPARLVGAATEGWGGSEALYAGLEFCILHIIGNAGGGITLLAIRRGPLLGPLTGECELAYNEASKEEEVPTGHAKLDTLRPERVRDIPPPGFTDMPTTD